jgi:AcrR family transcriptional regulator
MAAERRPDPRPAQTKARLLDAVISLLQTSEPTDLTIGSVVRAADVSRATLYRHFPSEDDLLAAAFHATLPPNPLFPEEGSLRERLTVVVQSWAELIAGLPTALFPLLWNTMGTDLIEPPASREDAAGMPNLHALRAHISAQYTAPFRNIFSSAQWAAEIGEIDRLDALALMVGPIAFGKLSPLGDFDYAKCARIAVDSFIAVHAKSRVDDV